MQKKEIHVVNLIFTTYSGGAIHLCRFRPGRQRKIQPHAPFFRDGLSWIIDGKPWPEVLRWYRMVLFGAGYASDRSKEGGISWERSREVLESGGELPAPELLRCRVRYFSDGLALGSARFVRAVRKRVFGKRGFSGGGPELEETGLCFARRRRRLPPTAPG